MAEYLSTQPYKGTRDFFPEEMRSRSWMFGLLEKTASSFGFEKIDAPIVEPLEIYLAKTSEEIISQQIYSFTDRGDRKVAIRPEMTPTVSRMVAAKIRELPRPIRWYSIPNLWRYERPGKGRLREHWQLNCDIFGAPDEFSADLEILQLAMEIPLAYGAGPEHFKVLLNHRQILNSLFAKMLGLPEEKWAPVARIMDKKAKLPAEEYRALLLAETLNDPQIAVLDQYLEQGLDFLRSHADTLGENGGNYIIRLIDQLHKLGYSELIEYDPSVVRGFDYYTGMVFEIFDTHPENRRSLFGGGRYDNLIGNYTKESANAVGFGLGDVTLADFLQVHNLYQTFERDTQIYLAAFADDDSRLQAFALARELRQQGYKAEVSLGHAKMAKQFQEAAAKNIPLVLIRGEEEIRDGLVSVKNLKNGEQSSLPLPQLPDWLRAYFSQP